RRERSSWCAWPACPDDSQSHFPKNQVDRIGGNWPQQIDREDREHDAKTERSARSHAGRSSRVHETSFSPRNLGDRRKNREEITGARRSELRRVAAFLASRTCRAFWQIRQRTI